MPPSPLGAIHYKSKDSICIQPAYYSRFCLYTSKLRVIIMIMSLADGGLFIICLQRGHKQMILLVFDLEVCTMIFSAHRQNSRKLWFLGAGFSVCGTLCLLTHTVKLNTYSTLINLPLHLLVLSCFITYHKMNRNNQQRRIDTTGMKYPSC